MWLIVLVLLLNYILWTLLLLLRVRGVTNSSYIDLGISFMVPVFGLMFMAVKKWSDRYSEREADMTEVDRIPEARKEEAKNSKDTESTEEDPMEIEVMEDKVSIAKSIVMDEDDVRDKVVPISEALVINDSSTRRELIIDVLYSDPEEYITQLFAAKQNGDTEVVHYAATALTEIQKEFDIKFQEIMKRKLDAEDNEELDVEYRKLLEKYISSGLLEGEVLGNQLRKYSGLLKKELSKDSVRGKWALINKKADADLRLRDTEALSWDLLYMKERWPERDGTYIVMINSAILRKDREALLETMKDIKDKGIYLSPELKNLVLFWGEDEKVS